MLDLRSKNKNFIGTLLREAPIDCFFMKLTQDVFRIPRVKQKKNQNLKLRTLVISANSSMQKNIKKFLI